MNSDYLPQSFPTNSPPPQPPVPVIPVATSRVALWRWWVATILMGSCPLLVGLLSFRHGDSGKGEMLPHSALGLILFCVVELGMFGVVWGIAWAFARGTKDDLFLRWRDGWKAAVWGFTYSFLMRVGLVFVLVGGIAVAQIFGVDPKHAAEYLNKNGQGAKDTFEPVMTHGGVIYQILMMTLVSFVVAGTREELWRSFTMGGMLKILPQRWGTIERNAVVLTVSSLLFGLGHVYQGATGVIGGALLGVALGGITLYHKNLWPAVIAHGCFDSLSFLLLLAVIKK